MPLKFHVLSRTKDSDVVYWGKEGPRLYLTEKNAIKQAKYMNEQEQKWSEQYPDVPHLQEYKTLGEWEERIVLI